MQNSALDIWISGAIAVVTVDFLVYPFDTLKTRIQSPSYNTIYKDAATNKVRKNVLFRGLYQGVVSVVLSTIPASGAFFTTYESVKSTLNNSTSSSSSPWLRSIPAPVINGLSSSAGEMVSCLLLTPAEVLKQNAQMVNRSAFESSPSSSPSTTNANGTSSNKTPDQVKRKAKKNVTLQVLSRFRSHPWRLWSGYTALVGRNLPFTGLNFPIFEAVKGYLVKRQREKIGYEPASGQKRGEKGLGQKGNGGEEPVYERAVLTGIAASMSGSIASVVTTPIDVVKTRMMLAASGPGDSGSGSSGASSGSSSPGPKAKGESVWTVGKQVLWDEGVKGLFKGGAIRVVWTALSMSIYLSMYEGGRFYLEKRRARKADEGRL
ncbi:putative mitochondrial carrier protein [Aspergillus stella-maris]|uniref:putative mitochondrial carrier protein n=1 Tax=Aspergillus stella-maris TaxID=1810926 RepID=UPI003CCE062E